MSRLFDAEEIRIYAENDGEFYDRHARPFLIALVKKLIKKEYDRARGLKVFKHLADLASRSYYNEMVRQEPGIFRSPWHEVFTSQEREKAAEEWEREFRARYRTGEYDWIKKEAR